MLNSEHRQVDSLSNLNWVAIENNGEVEKVGPVTVFAKKVNKRKWLLEYHYNGRYVLRNGDDEKEFSTLEEVENYINA